MCVNYHQFFVKFDLYNSTILNSDGMEIFQSPTSVIADDHLGLELSNNTCYNASSTQQPQYENKQG